MIKRWLYLYLWCRYLYRPAMRLAHRYNWHYAPPNTFDLYGGERNHWCQWCGLRGKTLGYDQNSPEGKKCLKIQN